MSMLVVVEYAVMSPAWKKTLTGRLLMSIFSLFAFTLFTASLTVFVGLTPWIIWLRFFTYVALTAAFLLIAILIAAIQEAAFLTEKDRLATLARQKEGEDGQVDHEPEDA